eukprot:scaffold5814_cov123-Isochrysis_galbana.AAC.8
MAQLAVEPQRSQALGRPNQSLIYRSKRLRESFKPSPKSTQTTQPSSKSTPTIAPPTHLLVAVVVAHVRVQWAWVMGQHTWARWSSVDCQTTAPTHQPPRLFLNPALLSSHGRHHPHRSCGPCEPYW